MSTPEAALLAPNEGKDGTYLLTQFRRFYAEVARVKQEVQAPLAAWDGTAAVEAAWKPLFNLLEFQALHAVHAGSGVSFETYQCAQYAMATLADEIFLNLDWRGRGDWPLLEAKLFGSHTGGEVFFDRVEALLTQGARAPRELALIYYNALALGFLGKYRDRSDRGALTRYRHDLFQIVYRERPGAGFGRTHLFPQSYRHTLREGEGKRLPNPRTWWLVFAGILLAWGLISTATSIHNLNMLKPAVCAIAPGSPGCPVVGPSQQP